MPDPKKIILITEDEPSMLRVLTDTLTQNGFSVLQAKEGNAGLNIALKQHPDLMLIDILMPGMDGLEVLKKLRQDAWGKNVPIILLTNISPDSNEIIQTIVESQPAYYFVKSEIKLDLIVEKIKQILYPHQQTKES